MDEAGIDFQVLSHSIPGLQGVDAATGRAVGAPRQRPAARGGAAPIPTASPAFAALPTADPRAAADELERTVTKLGFKGAMINGLTGGVFHDDKRFWPIYERAAALDVPIYIHPALPQPAVIEAYYKDYAQKHPGLLARRLGLHRRDRDAGHPLCAERRVRRLSRAQDHPRPYGRGAAVLSLAHQPRAARRA